ATAQGPLRRPFRPRLSGTVRDPGRSRLLPTCAHDRAEGCDQTPAPRGQPPTGVVHPLGRRLAVHQPAQRAPNVRPIRGAGCHTASFNSSETLSARAQQWALLGFPNNAGGTLTNRSSLSSRALISCSFPGTPAYTTVVVAPGLR